MWLFNNFKNKEECSRPISSWNVVYDAVYVADVKSNLTASVMLEDYQCIKECFWLSVVINSIGHIFPNTLIWRGERSLEEL